MQEDADVLGAYVKSWISGSLDRAATRESMTYTIVIHHLSSFIFNTSFGEKLLLRNKLVKSLLRDFSRKHQHEVLLIFCHSLGFVPSVLHLSKYTLLLYLVATFSLARLPTHDSDHNYL